MVKKLIAIVFIYICISISWFVLGGSVAIRSDEQDGKNRSGVNQLWGTPQTQEAPSAYYQIPTSKVVSTVKNKKTIQETVTSSEMVPISWSASTINVDLQLDYRKKGLLWYSTYKNSFSGEYRVVNDTESPRLVYVSFKFPTQDAVYDNFSMQLGGKEIKDIKINSGIVTGSVMVQPGQSEVAKIQYQSRGQDQWWYNFGTNVKQVKNLSLVMTTDFDKIDYPENSISPIKTEKTGKGWKLEWNYTNLLSGVQIGMSMPKKLNPGPWVSKVTFFAPVSLFLFFFLLLIFTNLKGIKLHPMNYFFIGSAFFSFHLLLSYLADHISIHAAFLICSVVSIFLVVSYMRLVVGNRFAMVEIGISQFVYLVLFSYTYFFEGYAGLAITILCIVTLFVVMQFTGKVDWDKMFQNNSKPPTLPPGTQG